MAGSKSAAGHRLFVARKPPALPVAFLLRKNPLILILDSNIESRISIRGELVRVAGLEPTASCSQSRRATNCATPGDRGRSARCLPEGRGAEKSATIIYYSGFLCGMQDAIRKETEARLCEKPRPTYRNVFLICGQAAQKSERGAVSVADAASNKALQSSASFLLHLMLQAPHACGGSCAAAHFLRGGSAVHHPCQSSRTVSAAPRKPARSAISAAGRT